MSDRYKNGHYDDKEHTSCPNCNDDNFIRVDDIHSDTAPPAAGFMAPPPTLAGFMAPPPPPPRLPFWKRHLRILLISGIAVCIGLLITLLLLLLLS